jgi:hypothetical protein
MHPDIEKDMNERLSVEVQTFIDNLAAAGFKVDDFDLIVTFHYGLEGELREEQRRVRVPEGSR